VESGSFEDCDEISPEDHPTCFCEEGVNELTFVYGGPEGGTIECSDATNDLQVFTELEVGARITFATFEIDSITCTASDADGNAIGGSFTIDSACDGRRPLVLEQEFGDGGLLTFREYVCSYGDTHSCLLDVELFTEVLFYSLDCEVLGSDKLVISEYPPLVEKQLDSPVAQIDVCNRKKYVVTFSYQYVDCLSGTDCFRAASVTIDPFVNTLPPTGTPTSSSTPSPSRDGTVGQPTPDPRGCSPTDSLCVNISCTSDCECEALHPGETTGLCICEDEVPDDCRFDDYGDDYSVNDGGRDDADDGGNSKESGDGGNGRSGRAIESGKKPSNDDDDGGNGADGGGTDGDDSDVLPLFSANCCDCDCLEKPCSCECYGFGDPMLAGPRDDPGENGSKDDSEDNVRSMGKDGEGKDGVHNGQRRSDRKLQGGRDDEDNRSHIRSRRPSSSSSLRKLVESVSDIDNDGGNSDDVDDDGGIDDCERPTYRCYYRKFYPGETGCVSQRKCKANILGFCARG
jgi:hypothetical protein